MSRRRALGDVHVICKQQQLYGRCQLMAHICSWYFGNARKLVITIWDFNRLFSTPRSFLQRRPSSDHFLTTLTQLCQPYGHQPLKHTTIDASRNAHSLSMIILGWTVANLLHSIDRIHSTRRRKITSNLEHEKVSGSIELWRGPCIRLYWRTLLGQGVHMSLRLMGLSVLFTPTHRAHIRRMIDHLGE